MVGFHSQQSFSVSFFHVCMEIKNMTAKYGNKNISVVGIFEGR